jgi:hypothetical protein
VYACPPLERAGWCGFGGRGVTNIWVYTFMTLEKNAFGLEARNGISN